MRPRLLWCRCYMRCIAPSKSCRGRDTEFALGGTAVNFMLKRLRQWLKTSQRIHLREEVATDLVSCLGIIDRFIDGTLRYPLEWDDFISWESEVPAVEAVRKYIAALEPLFFSKDAKERYQALLMTVAERNRVAALVGRPAREPDGMCVLPGNLVERSRDR